MQYLWSCSVKYLAVHLKSTCFYGKTHILFFAFQKNVSLHCKPVLCTLFELSKWKPPAMVLTEVPLLLFHASSALCSVFLTCLRKSHKNRCSAEPTLTPASLSCVIFSYMQLRCKFQKKHFFMMAHWWGQHHWPQAPIYHGWLKITMYFSSDFSWYSKDECDRFDTQVFIQSLRMETTLLSNIAVFTNKQESSTSKRIITDYIKVMKTAINYMYNF